MIGQLLQRKTQREKKSLFLCLICMYKCTNGRDLTQCIVAVAICDSRPLTPHRPTLQSSHHVFAADKALLCCSSDKAVQSLACCMFAVLKTSCHQQCAQAQIKKNCTEKQSQQILSELKAGKQYQLRLDRKEGFSYALQSTVNKCGNTHLIRKCSKRAFACPGQPNYLT